MGLTRGMATVSDGTRYGFPSTLTLVASARY